MRKNKIGQLHLPSLFQLLWSLLAASFFGAAALFFLSFGAAEVIGGLIAQSDSAVLEQSNQFAPYLIISSGMLWLMLITLPSIYYSFRQLAQPYIVSQKNPASAAITEMDEGLSEQPILLAHKAMRIMVIVLPLGFFAVLGAGQLCSKQALCEYTLLPFFHILGVCIPIAWYIGLGVYGIYSLKKNTFWGVLANSVSLSPLIILMLEGLIFVFFAIAMGIGLYVTLGSEQLGAIIKSMEGAGDREALFNAIMPLLAQPLVVGGILLFIAVLVPLVEEALKPLILWLIIIFLWQGKRNAPEYPQAYGFTIGLLCGGGFALLESLFLSAGSAEWVAIVGSRAAASLLHVVHGGIMGWTAGMAVEAFKESDSWLEGMKGLAYLLLGYGWVVLIHGLWNGMTLLAVLAELSTQVSQIADLPLVLPLGKVAPFGLVIMILGQLLILLLLNRLLRWQLLRTQLAPKQAV